MEPVTPVRGLAPSTTGQSATSKQRAGTPDSCFKQRGDRFIPTRKSMNLDLAQYSLLQIAMEKSMATSDISTPGKDQYRKALAENFQLPIESPTRQQRILAFKQKLPLPTARPEHPGIDVPLPLVQPNTRHLRCVARGPEQILDAPDLVDDFYTNLLDWSCGNVLALALGKSVYLWSVATQEVTELMTHARENVASLAWAPDGKHVAVGLWNAEVQLWRTSPCKQVRRLQGHAARVGSLAWNNHILTTGGHDALILNHDVRVREHVTSQFSSHTQAVCGLRWSPSGRHLASGGNDNLVHIWDVNAATSAGDRYLHRLVEHRAAVKALAWCPFQTNLVATGGGQGCGHMKFWNVHMGVCVNTVNTGSQVCSLVWNKWERTILSAHGWLREDDLNLWSYPSLLRLASMRGHSERVLHMVVSPGGTRVATAAADETMRLWRAFRSPPQKRCWEARTGSPVSKMSSFTSHIR